MRRKHKFSSFYLYNIGFLSVLLKENFLWDIMKPQFNCPLFKGKTKDSRSRNSPFISHGYVCVRNSNLRSRGVSGV